MVGPRQLLVFFLAMAPCAAFADEAPEFLTAQSAFKAPEARVLLTRAPAAGLGLTETAPRLARMRWGGAPFGGGRALPGPTFTADGGPRTSGVLLASSAACAAASVSGLFVASWLKASFRSEEDDALAEDLRRRNQVIGATSYGLGAAAIGLGVGAVVAGKW